MQLFASLHRFAADTKSNSQKVLSILRNNKSSDKEDIDGSETRMREVGEGLDIEQDGEQEEIGSEKLLLSQIEGR